MESCVHSKSAGDSYVRALRSRKVPLLAVCTLAACLSFPEPDRTALLAQNAATQCGKWTLGNCNCDNSVDLGDAIFILRYLFYGVSSRKPCSPLCDFDVNGKFDLGDAISILNYYFFGKGALHETPNPEEMCDGLDNNCNGQSDEDCHLSAEVSWSPVLLDIGGKPENTYGYRVYFGTRSRTYPEVRDAGSAHQYRIGDLLPGVKYYFAVTAYDAAGNESAYSTEVTWQYLN